jgi:hypothetical protein
MTFARFFVTVLLLTAAASAREFTVLVYNVENLTGADGKTASPDYSPARYSRVHLLTKLNNIAKIIAQFDHGRGPDIILFQELERDFGADQYLFDHAGMLRSFASLRIEDMLGAGFTREISRLPVEALLLKTFEDRGLKGYHVVAADDAPRQDARRYVTQLNVVFTRFPVSAVRTFAIPNAPATLEVKVQVDGYALYLFDNHWKGDPTDPMAERIRDDAARLLRDRLDEIFELDPNADVIIGGDFNSFYDQKARFGGRTALQDVLRVQSDEILLRGPDADLYNLWYELPRDQRGSEIFRRTWGTFMHMIISRGLYDFYGVQYIDNSFGIGAFDGMNATDTGEPVRWSFAGLGSGYSEHFPLYARFKTVRTNRTTQYISLTPPPGAVAAKN